MGNTCPEIVISELIYYNIKCKMVFYAVPGRLWLLANKNG